jgi:thiol-disulfide isomerase/thioredoxin
MSTGLQKAGIALGVLVTLALLSERAPSERPMPLKNRPQGMPPPQARRPPPPQENSGPIALPALSVLHGKERVTLAGARARPMLLHLWASWCGPCRAELPSLLAYGKTGPAEVVAVTVDDHFEDVEKFFNGKIPREVFWDDKITVEAAMGVDSLPTTFLVDQKGMVLARYNGMQEWGGKPVQEDVVETLAGRR